MTPENKSPENHPGTGHEFMEKTRYRSIGKSDQQKGLPQPPLELPPDPHARIIYLPRPESLGIPPLDLRAAIERRRSIRSYFHEPITLEELSFLFWCTQGVQKVHGSQVTFRTVPSAGARHAFETYLLANNVEELETGLYRFLALTHRLQQMDTDPAVTHRITSACFDQQFILRSGGSSSGPLSRTG